MTAKSVTSEHRASVTNMSPSEAAIDAKPNKAKRNGFQLVMSRIAKGVKSIKKFLRNHAHQAPRSPAASLAKRLSVENIANAFPEQYRQRCIQYLEEAAQERYALPGSEQFGELPKEFTKCFNNVFSKEFQKPAEPFLLQAELNQTEVQAQLIILNALYANQDGWKTSPDTDLYMRFLSDNDALAFNWVAASQATDTCIEDVPQPPAVELSATETRASTTVSEDSLADWNPGADLMSAQIEDLVAPLAMPAQTPGDIVDRVYRTNVSARQMLITANVGDTKDSRNAFDAFSSRLDEIYRSSFENQFDDFRSQDFSVFEAANMAAETAFLTTALRLSDETAEANDEVGIQYVKDMFSKEEEVRKLAAKLLEGPEKLMTEEAQSGRIAADKLLAKDPFNWATQGLPIIAEVLKAHTTARHSLTDFLPVSAAFSSRFDEAYQFYFEAACTALLADNLSHSEAANIAALSAFSAAALSLRDQEIGGDGYHYAQSMLNHEEEITAMAASILEGAGEPKTEEVRSAHAHPETAANADVVDSEQVATSSNAAAKRAPSHKLNTTGKFVCNVFKRARKTCVGTSDFKQVSMSYDGMFEANFNAHLEEEQLKFSAMSNAEKKQLPKTWAFRAALGAAKKATKTVTNLMKDSNDADEKAYAKKFMRVRQAFSEKVNELLRPSQPRQTQDARVAPQKTSA